MIFRIGYPFGVLIHLMEMIFLIAGFLLAGEQLRMIGYLRRRLILKRRLVSIFRLINLLILEYLLLDVHAFII